MKLDIIIPHYKEEFVIVKRLLDSIKEQTNIDFNDINVIICSDGGKVVLPEDKLQEYPFNIEYHIEEHQGVAAIRNTGFRYGTSPYVIFCDSDDMFYNIDNLSKALNINEEADIIISDYYEEQNDGTNKLIIDDKVRIHGKIFRRQFLEDENIVFPEGINFNEDFSFMKVAEVYAKKKINVSDVFYLWTYNKESITRKSVNAFYENYSDVIRSNEYTINEYIKRGDIDLARQFICGIIYETYFIFVSDQWKNHDNIKETERYFCKWLKCVSHLWNTTDKKYKEEFLKFVIEDFAHFFNTTPDILYKVMNNISFKDWLKNIQKKYK